MRYHEYQPPSELSPWIKLYWVFESRSNASVPETIVADGFPELIIHFRSPFSELDCVGQPQTQSVAVACGQLTKPLVLHSALDAGMIGIRFQPSGMAPFLSTSMQSLTDARVPAEDLFGDVDRLIDEVVKSTSDVQRIAACNRFLIRGLRSERDHPWMRRALDVIQLKHGQITVESLATLVGRSRRSLELTFQREVGATPKMYCRITRFRHILEAVSEADPSMNWVQFALESGYFDQSHLIRDFQRFAGNSPKSFLKRQSAFAQAVNQA